MGRQVGIVGLFFLSADQVGQLERLGTVTAPGGKFFDQLVDILAITLFEIFLLDVERAPERRTRPQIVGIAGQHFGQGVVAIGFEHVLGVQLRLAIGHLPIVARLGANKPEVDRLQIEHLVGRDALQQHLVPRRRPRVTFAVHCQCFGVPVWDVEVGLLQVQHVDKLVLQHAGPIVALGHISGTGQGHDLAGARPYRTHVGQADHPRAKPAVAARVASAIEDLEQRLFFRLVAELLDVLRVDLVFQVASHVPGQQAILHAVEP